MKQKQPSYKQSPILAQILGLSSRVEADPESNLQATLSNVSLGRRKNIIQDNKKKMSISTAGNNSRVLQPRKSDENVAKNRISSQQKSVYKVKPSGYALQPLASPEEKSLPVKDFSQSCRANKTLQQFKQASIKPKTKTKAKVSIVQESSIYLSEEEKKKFETVRFMDGLDRLSLIGKGGNALVWLGKGPCGQSLAVKQLCKSGNDSATMNEISFYQLLAAHPDLHSVIMQLVRYEIQSHFIWLAFPLGGETMSKALFSMKGQFHKGERVYRISASPLCSLLASQDDFSLLKVFLRRMANGLKTLKDIQVIHTDLKLENILMMTETGTLEEQVHALKIIDFGSCIQMGKPCFESVNITTPEYMPPELLDTLNRPSSKSTCSLQESLLAIYKTRESVYKIDVWSLGVIVLEIISAIPMWISYKCIFKRKGKDMLGAGLFSNINRSFDKIINKQKAFCSNIQENMLSYMTITNGCQAQLVDLLSKMLEFQQTERISIESVLSHPFLN